MATIEQAFDIARDIAVAYKSTMDMIQDGLDHGFITISKSFEDEFCDIVKNSTKQVLEAAFKAASIEAR